jgi:uncharacterized membrane-anchored protein YhcB (DUF1043 family)
MRERERERERQRETERERQRETEVETQRELGVAHFSQHSLLVKSILRSCSQLKLFPKKEKGRKAACKNKS